MPKIQLAGFVIPVGLSCYLCTKTLNSPAIAMNIVLVNPPWIETYGEFKESAKTSVFYPPLGLCYLSSTIKQAGHSATIIDCDVEELPDQQIIDLILSCHPDLVGITAATTVFHNAQKIAQAIKQSKNIPIVLGGPHITLMPEHAMQSTPAIDYGVSGEGEETFKELVIALASQQEVEAIQGLIYRKNGQIRVNPPRPFIQDLDAIPFPDFASLKLEKYMTHVPQKGVIPFLPVTTGRGCPYGCLYCSAEAMSGKKVRYRSVENVLQEFDYIANTLHITHLAFVDETLTLHKKRFMAVCQGILDRGLQLSMEGWTRPKAIDQEVADLMQKAGFTTLSFGIESGDPEILKVIRPDVKNEDVLSALAIAKKAGLETKGFFMIGHPYETRQTVNNTFQFIKQLRDCDEMYVNITTPFPGTRLYDMALKGEGGLKLLSEDYAQYRKYGNAVITVNDLTREDLIKLQKKAFLMFYLTPRRIIHRLRRAGIKSAFISGVAFVKSILGDRHVSSKRPARPL